MRKSLLVGLLGMVLAVASMIPLTKSGATQASQQKGERSSQSKTRHKSALPNYDIRLADDSEFLDYDLKNGTAAKGAAQSARSHVASSGTLSRLQFR